MKQTKVKSRKASQASLALDRARIKACIKPFSSSDLLGRYLEAVIDGGGKIWLVSSK